MYSKDPVWLLPEDIIKKYKDFCFYNNLSERRIVKLFDSFLLVGRDNRKAKKIEVIQESFEYLKRHIQFNYDMQGSKDNSEIKRPDYLKYKYQIIYDKSLVWYTPKDLLETYFDLIKYDKNFNTEFIGDLAHSGLIMGRFHTSENCYLVSSRSFIWLLKYRKFIVEQYGLLPPPDFPQA